MPGCVTNHGSVVCHIKGQGCGRGCAFVARGCVPPARGDRLCVDAKERPRRRKKENVVSNVMNIVMTIIVAILDPLLDLLDR